MSKLIEKIKLLEDLFYAGKTTDEQIRSAEERLGVKFATDYKEYVKEYGVITYYGHELTGICRGKRLDVCKITVEEREDNLQIPLDFYVLEQLNIDGVVVWQNSKGEVFETIVGRKVKKICESLLEYIEM